MHMLTLSAQRGRIWPLGAQWKNSQGGVQVGADWTARL